VAEEAQLLHHFLLLPLVLVEALVAQELLLLDIYVLQSVVK
jgi:hypothetical protein